MVAPSIGYQVLVFLLSILCAITIELIRRKLGTEKFNKIKNQLETKQGLAWTAVLFVEQVYENLDGEDKFAKAAEWISDQASKNGIDITMNEIEGLIESAVIMLKNAITETE